MFHVFEVRWTVNSRNVQILGVGHQLPEIPLIHIVYLYMGVLSKNKVDSETWSVLHPCVFRGNLELFSLIEAQLVVLAQARKAFFKDLERCRLHISPYFDLILFN